MPKNRKNTVVHDKCCKQTLSKTEWQIIKMRYFRDLAQEEVANALKSNKMWVSRHERIALDKLKSSLL
jgi:DNA-directed RNA polymerase specialized sigma subunit